ncbi:MAG: hypothetical protein AVDCRST_MAG08-864 [uncultured Acetobacteraceae bacterium]|uniref:Uncharacterized protein n=1 Tax=uncultured Acetobacteraceae bacterium TaxID=169975 RepID=A0A6J4HLU1_9PROT|nr:MAG: hypothetical protein AVDCRST_MAG08-864 [uncultured Acetobacteraceae bacterium]
MLALAGCGPARDAARNGPPRRRPAAQRQGPILRESRGLYSAGAPRFQTQSRLVMPAPDR